MKGRLLFQQLFLLVCTLFFVLFRKATVHPKVVRYVRYICFLQLTGRLFMAKLHV